MSESTTKPSIFFFGSTELLLSAFYRRDDFGIISQIFDEQNLILIDGHARRSVHFLTQFYQAVFRCRGRRRFAFGLLLCLERPLQNQIIHVIQRHIGSLFIGNFAEVCLTIRQKNSLIFRRVSHIG